MQNSNNKSKWLFYIGVIITYTIVGISWIFNIYKQMMFLSAIVCFIVIIRYICIIYIIYLHVNNKVPTSVFIPSFITKWIAHYKYVLDYKDNKERLSKIINFYYTHMYIIIFTLFMSLLCAALL